MKTILRSFVAELLAFAARGVVRRYRPKIVMVTGSVGKTSTKDAVAAVLSTSFFVRKSEKSYNSEFGVPLTIFGVPNPWGNPFSWLRVIKEAVGLLVLPNHYPNLLVLEVGADRPGDLAKILRIATPDAVIITRLPDVPVHVEAYATPQAVRDEEFSPAYALPPAAPLIVSSSDSFAMEMALRTPAHVVSYGVAPESDTRLSQIGFHTEQGIVVGMKAEVTAGDEKGEVIIKGSIGEAQMFSAGAAVTIGRLFGISLTQSIVALAALVPPPGRGRLISGKNESVLIDESYNSSPAAVEIALSNLKKFPARGRRIAVLGDMLELGRYSVKEHERIGELAAQTVDVVIGVGIRAKQIVEAARRMGMTVESAFAVDDSSAVAGMLSSFVQKGDVVLVKGSQSIRTERIVESLLGDPVDISKLVRQEREWKKRV
ncbi:MAG TPA: UDP-N-acetylmuramoyl-tripeptide--D-alanyl-D-alanine ligase [Candidatus Paceibacterota bacterium]|nr:UDP-N-acetylmuramoyl-tripeptide--D-alanyl-D-alanine ligase [Candidatus Paceibacterota bacterium]